MSSASRRWAGFFLGLIVTGLFVWLLLRQTDLKQLGESLRSISPFSLFVALGFLTAGYTVRVLRWWRMLRALDPQVSVSACGWPFLVSIALNNLLPFRAGDAIRVVGFRKQLRSPAMRILGTLVIERLLDLMTLLGVFFVGLLFIGEGRLPETIVRLAQWITAVGVLAVVAILLFSAWTEQLIEWITELPYLAKRGWSQFLRRHTINLLDALALLRTPRLVLELIALSVLVWLFEGAVFATVSYSLDIQTPAAGPWFALSTGTLATLLPSTPGYIGTFDYFAMRGLVAYGADQDKAAAFAVVVHAVLWLPLTTIGLAYFLRPGTKMLRKNILFADSSQEKPE